MRILLINTTEKIGGPAVAASRLMEALKNNGIKAKLLVRDKQTEQITVVELPHNLRMVWKFVWERIVIWKANHFNRNHLFAAEIPIILSSPRIFLATAHGISLCPR